MVNTSECTRTQDVCPVPQRPPSPSESPTSVCSPQQSDDDPETIEAVLQQDIEPDVLSLALSDATDSHYEPT